MYSIGEFSRLCMVTAKTLRHYDGIGLLKPAYTSEETGYRYYEAAQFRDMFFIQKCKEYGFTLEETGALLHADAHLVAARFAAKYAEQAAALARRRALMKSMEQDIEWLKKGMDLMSSENMEIKVVDRRPVDLVSVREVIAMRDFDRLFEKLLQKIERSGLTCTGGPIALYHCEEFDPEHVDVELGMPVSSASPETRVLPGGKCAMAVHAGSYANLGETYAAIAKWMEEQGYRTGGAPFDQYLNSPHEVPEEQLMTEVYFPIAL